MPAGHLRTGRRGERIACRHLINNGYDILARRWRGRTGEIDLVAYEDDLLVFIEVKTRRTNRYGEPWEFVDWRKRQLLRRTAEEFIAAGDLGAFAYRFDIISVTGNEVTLFRNAF